MGRLNDAPEACHVTETLRVTCYGNFEGGPGKGVFFEPRRLARALLPPSQSIPCQAAMFTAGGRVLPCAALAMRGAATAMAWLGLAIGRTAHHLVSPKTGMSPAAGDHHLEFESR